MCTRVGRGRWLAGLAVAAGGADGTGGRIVRGRRLQGAYRAVVFLDTGLASPLSDAQRSRFEYYFHAGGDFVGVGSAVETDES